MLKIKRLKALNGDSIIISYGKKKHIIFWCNASVILAVRLPIKWLGEQGEGFKRYLLRNKEVTFRCNGTRYHVKIEDVEVYAQGFAAVAADLSNYYYQGFNIVADIGGHGRFYRAVTGSRRTGRSRTTLALSQRHWTGIMTGKRKTALPMGSFSQKYRRVSRGKRQR